jgi:hypothetical protein
MKGRGVLVALVLAATGAAAKGPTPSEPPPESREIFHPAGGFSFFLPKGWTASTPASDDPDAVDAKGEGVMVRFVYRRGDVGYDGLHAMCMTYRLQKDADPQTQYEYDYVGGLYGALRTLDSAFVVEYETPISGQRKWRQRNLTMVGNGHSLCVITNAPTSVWKKSQKVRSLLDAVLGTVKFHE